MDIKLTHLAGATLSLLAVAAVSASEARAQSVEAPQTIPDAMEEILSDQSGKLLYQSLFRTTAWQYIWFWVPRSGSASRQRQPLKRVRRSDEVSEYLGSNDPGS